MIVLGIHDGHNASVALLKDGEIIACVSEERFSRQKNDIGYPYRAIENVLNMTGIKSIEIDRAYFSTIDTDPFMYKTKREAVFSIKDYVEEMHSFWKPLFYEGKTTNYWETLAEQDRFKEYNKCYDFSFFKTEPKENWGELFNKERVRVLCDHIGIPQEKVDFADHHTTHAYYAYFASPHVSNEKAVIITADAFGDGCNATISTVKNGVINEIFRTDMCHIARLYRWITLLLGMKPLEHEYKVMGLAPYAKEYISRPAYEIFKNTLRVEGLDFIWNEKPTDMYFYFKEKLEGIRFDGIAGGIQLWLEETLSQWVRNILKATDADTIYFSGGLSMNVKANKVIAELPDVKRLNIPPSGGDESTAIGAAYYGYVLNSKSETCISLKNAYLGGAPTYEEANIECLDFVKANPQYDIIQNVTSSQIAVLLKKGLVLGRCCGPMEFGARALGNRSILCDPSKAENLQKINEKIKFRDFWMPFTPSMLAEKADDYLVNPKRIEAKYMTIAFDSTPLAREHLKAAIHPYDFTIRAQMVYKDINPEYYSIIDEFRKLTGISGLLNTSLNLHGLPIVCDVKDALYTLLHSDLDGLVLPNILLIKKEFIISIES
nr:carbamoyltransferase C-terminal domain-containing protein [uncultured Anaeromusa sp.]